MGLFSFFIRKKKETDKEPENLKTIEGKCEVRVVQRPMSVELEGVDRVKPNCYGNYLYIPEARFIVRGVNTATNRKNKKTFTASSEADAIQQAEAVGLSGPFEITVDPADEATESQLAYAANIGLKVPNGACKTDLSALLSRAEENDERAALPGVLEFLAGRGWRGSALIGYDAMLATVRNFLTEQRDGLAFYAYYIDQAENNCPLGNFDKDPKKDRYLAFADYAIQNEKIMEHYKRWRQDKTWPTAKTWGIYKDYREYCGGKK